MRLDRLLVASVLGFACCGSVQCLADEAPATDKKAADGSGPEKIFDQLDGNHDGKLTADEIPVEQKPYFERLLRSADGDKNGELTRAEFGKGTDPDVPAIGPDEAGPRPMDRRPDFDPRQMFSRLDRNSNGKLSLDEIPDPMRSRIKPLFDRLEKTEISADEFARVADRMRGGPGGGMFTQSPLMRLLDKNNDRRLSKSEFARVADVFDELDKNNDGELDGRELFGMPNFTGGMARPGASRPADAAGKPSDKMPAKPAADVPVKSAEAPVASKPAETPKNPNVAGDRGKLRKFDTDGDGRVSRDEAQGRIRKNFDRLDTNGDGFLERDELQKALRDAQSRKSADGVNVAG